MNKKTYSSAIKKTPYKYYISKTIAKLILKGYDRNEVFFECFNNNEVQIDSLERRREVTNVVYERLLNLDRYLLEEFVNADVSTSKFILVYAIAKTDQLFFDFLYELYREALLGVKKYISIDDFDLFFKSKKETDPTVKSWGDYTIDQLGKGYRNILVESSLGRREKKNIYVVKPIVHPDVVEHLNKINETPYLKALLGE